jgi:hypothetical protein
VNLVGKGKEYNERKLAHDVQLLSIESELDAELCTTENDSETFVRQMTSFEQEFKNYYN